MEFPVIFIFIAVGVLVVAGIIYGRIMERKRREAFLLLSAKLGLEFRSGKDRSLPGMYHFLDKLAKGENRYAYNILSGNYFNQDVKVFDYHYETHSHDSKGRRQTHHHHFSVFLLTMPQVFPELVIAPESLFSKIAQAFGYDDIDFESHEFSRKFCVRSKDKKFAYDFCNAQMISYLLDNTDLSIEVDVHTLALLFNKRLSVEAIEPNLNRLHMIRELMPDYLFAKN